MADDNVARDDLVEGAIKTYLDQGGSPGPLIRLFVSFRIENGSDEERSMLEPLADLYSSRNINVDDEGLQIYNIPNRMDSVFGLCYLLAFLDKELCAQHAKDIITGINAAIYHVNPAVQNSACLSLSAIAHLVKDELIESFGSIFEALLLQCQTRLDRYPHVKKNMDTLNRQLSIIVAPDHENVHPASLQVFVHQFERLGDTLCPHSRRFLINWLVDFLCDEMLRSLPAILAGLFNMTSFPKDSPDAYLYKESESESLELIKSLYEKLHGTYKIHQVKTQTEALKWASLLIQIFPREVFKCVEFKAIFLKELDIPQAHFLMGLHIAIKGSYDLEAARRHLFKAINHVKEASHAMAMVAILSGNHDVANFFFDMVYTERWIKVAEMQRVVVGTITEIMEEPTAAKFNYKSPACVGGQHVIHRTALALSARGAACTILQRS